MSIGVNCVRGAGKWVPVDTTFVMQGWGPELRSPAPPHNTMHIWDASVPTRQRLRILRNSKPGYWAEQAANRRPYFKQGGG